MEELLMLKKIALYTLGFAAAGVAFGLIKTALKGEALAVDPGFIVTMAVAGGLGAVIAWRRDHR
jgi:hypothetical protein